MTYFDPPRRVYFGPLRRIYFGQRPSLEEHAPRAQPRHQPFYLRDAAAADQPAGC